MTREQFIEEIEKRGFKQLDDDTFDWYSEVHHCHARLDVVSIYEPRKSACSFFAIPYSAITVELINAVAGKEKP